MNTNTTKTLELIIPDNQAGERLDQSLATLLPDYSRTQIKEWIDNGLVLLNGKPAKAKVKVKGGEEISLQPVIKAQPDWEAQDIPLNIMYEDDSLVVINKPAGLVVHPGTGNASRTLLNALLHHAPELKNLPRAGILHRLDKDTTGLLVVAKTAAALKSLTHQLKKRSMIREYQAVVNGSMISGGEVDAAIERHPLQRKKMAVSETGKPAITHYRIAEKFRGHTHLKLKLETGRTHQIRVHMAYIRHPLVGDSTYGGRVQLAKNMTEDAIQALRGFKRQALHAFALGFRHPETGKDVYFEIELPDEMKELISALREDTRKSK